MGLNPDFAPSCSLPSMHTWWVGSLDGGVYLPNQRNLTQSGYVRTRSDLRGQDTLPASPHPHGGCEHEPRRNQTHVEGDRNLCPAVVPAGGREPEHPPGCQKSPRKRMLRGQRRPSAAPGRDGTCVAGYISVSALNAAQGTHLMLFKPSALMDLRLFRLP